MTFTNEDTSETPIDSRLGEIIKQAFLKAADMPNDGTTLLKRANDARESLMTKDQKIELDNVVISQYKAVLNAAQKLEEATQGKITVSDVHITDLKTPGFDNQGNYQGQMFEVGVPAEAFEDGVRALNMLQEEFAAALPDEGHAFDWDAAINPEVDDRTFRTEKERREFEGLDSADGTIMYETNNLGPNMAVMKLVPTP